LHKVVAKKPIFRSIFCLSVCQSIFFLFLTEILFEKTQQYKNLKPKYKCVRVLPLGEATYRDGTNFDFNSHRSEIYLSTVMTFDTKFSSRARSLQPISSASCIHIQAQNTYVSVSTKRVCVCTTCIYHRYTNTYTHRARRTYVCLEQSVNSRTQIYVDLRYIDPQARVLNYCFR